MARNPKVLDLRDKPTKKRRWRVSRRGFLIGLGVTGTGLALGWQFAVPEARRRIAGALDVGGAPGGVKASPTAWFEVGDPEVGNGPEVGNKVTLHMPKVEMGQGIHTALAQVAAEELELEWDQLDVVSASTARGLKDSFGTGGSSSVNTMYLPLREAAATLREMLRAKAAETWDTNPALTVAMNGSVFQQQNPRETLTYSEIANGVTDWEIPKDPPALKAKRDFRYIGQPAQRVDFREKLTGRAQYGYDMRLPGMLYGAVARPPTLRAELVSASAGGAMSVKGVEAVVIEEGFAGVVATSRAKAYEGVAAMELGWAGGISASQDELLEMVRTPQQKGVVIQREGRVDANLGAEVVTAEYSSPFAAHAHLEPQAALVDVRADSVTAHVSTQSPELVREDIAEVLGRKKEEVEVTATYLGGGFGRRLNVEVALEAARLSKAAGKPVHVGWNRNEEFRYGYVRPATHSRFRASLNPDGSVNAVEHQQASGDVAFPFFPAPAATVLGADFGAWRGSMVHYSGIPHRRTIAHRVQLPVKTGWWRGLGLLANTFALESFMDELAHKAGQDALEYRLAHFDNSDTGKRFKTVLSAAADAAGWGKPMPKGRALGIACSSDVRTVCAQVAEVSSEDGKIRVHKMTAAIDPGLIINPDGVKAQTQGSVVMGLSSTFLERLTFKDGLPEASNFDRYPLLTIKDTPEIEVVLLESGDVPYGVGEPPLGPVAAATANAVFALTGQRLREIPLELS